MKRRLVPVLGSSLVLWAVHGRSGKEESKMGQTMLARMSVAPAVDIDHDGAGRLWRRRLLKTMLILTLFTGGLAVYEFVEFHPPASLVEALLQRQ